MLEVDILLFNKRGFSIIEVLVVAGITIATFSVTSILIIQVTDAVKKSEMRGNLILVVQNNENLIKNSDILEKTGQASGLGNKELENCISSSGLCTANTSYELSILSATGSPLLSGTRTAPLRLDRNGSPCALQSLPSAVCPFISYSFFTATCPGNTSSCPMASFFKVDLTIEVDPQLQDHNLYRFPSLTRSSHFSISKFTNQTSTCSANKYVAGIDSNGAPICEDSNRAIANIQCPANQGLRGFDQNGQAVCAAIESSGSGGGGSLKYKCPSVAGRSLCILRPSDLFTSVLYHARECNGQASSKPTCRMSIRCFYRAARKFGRAKDFSRTFNCPEVN